MLLYTSRKLTIQVRWLDVTNTSELPIIAFQASLNTTEHMFVFGLELLLSCKVVITRLLVQRIRYEL